MYGPTSYSPLAVAGNNMKNGTALYQRAQSKSRVNAFKSMLTRKGNTLLGYDNVLQGKRVRARRYGGRETVQIDQIVASEGRTEDFDRQFYPVSNRNQDRWLSVLSARMHGVALPPVSLLRVEDQYVVVDGHHRISVARALGEIFIEAEITVLEIGA